MNKIDQIESEIKEIYAEEWQPIAVRLDSDGNIIEYSTNFNDYDEYSNVISTKADDLTTTIRKMIETDAQAKNIKTENFDQYERDLNRLSEDSGSTGVSESLSVMKMINDHNIKTPSESVRQLNRHAHSEGVCDTCGQNCSNNINELSAIMYRYQLHLWGYIKYDRDTCRRYIRDVFGRRSIQGSDLENKAVNKLSDKLKNKKIEKSDDDDDIQYSIDVVIYDRDTKHGVQVKPTSIKGKEYTQHLKRNLSNMSDWNGNTYILYYNQNEQFTNIDEILKSIK